MKRLKRFLNFICFGRFGLCTIQGMITDFLIGHSDRRSVFRCWLDGAEWHRHYDAMTDHYRETWYQDGKFHRKGAPAWICRKTIGGPIVEEQWYEHGRIHREDGYAITGEDEHAIVHGSKRFRALHGCFLNEEIFQELLPLTRVQRLIRLAAYWRAGGADVHNTIYQDLLNDLEELAPDVAKNIRAAHEIL